MCNMVVNKEVRGSGKQTKAWKAKQDDSSPPRRGPVRFKVKYAKWCYPWLKADPKAGQDWGRGESHFPGKSHKNSAKDEARVS